MRFGIALAFALLLASMAFASNYPVVPVTFTALNPETLRVATAEGDVACGISSSADWSYDGVKLIEIKSPNNFIFGGPNDVMSGDYLFDKVLFDPIGLTNNGEILNGTYYQDPNQQGNWKPRVFWMVPGRDCWNWNYFTNAPHSYSDTIGVPSLGNQARIQNWKLPLGSGGQMLNLITIIEDPQGDGNHARYDQVLLAFIADNPSYSTHRFKQSDAEIPIVYYLGTSPLINYVTYEPRFVTERGSVVQSLGTSDVSMQFATQIAKPSFTFGGGPTSSRGHTFETVITDTVDRTLQNRMNTNPEDIWPDSLNASDTNSSTSPLRAVAPGTTLAKNLYRIGGAQYPSFANYVFPDPKIYSFYIGMQSFWVGSTPKAVKYDSDSSIRDISVNAYSAMAYSEKFGGGLETGIPVCTGGLAIQGDWSSCGANSTNRTDRHRVKIKFMGADWVITHLQQPAAQLASATAAINGGQVRLGKERVYGILNLGQQLDDGYLSGGYFKVRFARLVSNGVAIIQIYDPVEILVGEFQIAAGQTYTFQDGKGRMVKVHLYDAHVSGPAGGAVAEMATYSEDIILKDGARYNLVGVTDPNKNFKVSLLWKNRDYVGAGSSTVADSLREIVIYNTDIFSGVKTVKGDSFNFLATSPAYVVRYDGITPVVTSIGGGNTGNDSIRQPLPSDYLNGTNSTNITCAISPNPRTLAVNQSGNFSLSCFSQGWSVECPTITWRAGIGTITASGNYWAILNSGTRAGNGYLYASGQGGIPFCRASVTVKGYIKVNYDCATQGTTEVDCVDADTMGRVGEWTGTDGCTYQCNPTVKNEQTTCPASPIEVDCSSFPKNSAKKWVAGDGCTYACKGEAAACKPISKVECQAGYEATMATDSSGCQSYQCIPSKSCPTPLKVECKTGFALYSYTDSSGCPAYGCFGICPTPAKVECKAGYESYIYTASTGCGAYGCRLSTTAKTPAATSTNDKAASTVSAGAFVDEGSGTYAKLMNVLGVYVEQYKG